ncbi:MAG: acyl-CoA thioesterase [Actinobacteria bacterium]|nr:acyl-CoA thioesterase [Actinomycetota bacterium]
MADTPWTTSIRLRSFDLDYLGHVTAAAFLGFFEEARVRWLSDAWESSTPTYVVARQEIDFQHELRLEEEEITIRIQLARVGRSSFDVVEALEVRPDRLKATSAATLVAWDDGRRRARPLDEGERAALLAQLSRHR